jgi:hypothetical protein
MANMNLISGHLSCVFYLNVIHDPKLQNAESTKNISETLKLFAYIIELLLEVEHYCWLVYNATIYIYKMSLYMMQYGQSKIVNRTTLIILKLNMISL